MGRSKAGAVGRGHRPTISEGSQNERLLVDPGLQAVAAKGASLV